MDNKPFYVRALLTLTVMALMLTIFTVTGEASSSGVKRIAGQDRYETSAKIATEAHDSTETVILTRGDDAGEIADGLAASVLAGIMEAPILLTRQDSIPSVILSVIDDLEAKKVIILGGEKAVSSTVETILKEKGLEIARIAGDSRVETAALIAEKAKEAGDLANFAFIVNGYEPADFLLAGPPIFKNNATILQVMKNSVPDITKNTIEKLGVEKLYIIGGTAVVSDLVERKLSKMATVERLAGEDRFATSVEVAKAIYPGESDYSIVGGYSYADAIGAAVLGKPALYIGSLPPVIDEYLDERLTSNSNVTIIGGENVADNSLVREIQVKIDPDQVLDTRLASRQKTSKYGEYLDWSEARNIYSRGNIATVTDVSSGLKFNVKRRGGTNHADSEPLTSEDTAIMKRIYGGSWSWSTRGIIVRVDGRDIAASMNGMPHGGQNISNNSFPGHFCIHFKNSRNHNTNSINPSHQASVKRAAGIN